MALSTDLMRSKVLCMANSSDETGVRVRKTSDYEGHVWRKYAFGAAGEDGDGIFGDDGFPDGPRECAGEVVDAAVA